MGACRVKKNLLGKAFRFVTFAPLEGSLASFGGDFSQTAFRTRLYLGILAVPEFCIRATYENNRHNLHIEEVFFMAIIFEMWVECTTEEDTRKVAHHFEGVQQPLQSTRTITWKTSPIEPLEHTFGLIVWSPDLPRGGLPTLQGVVDLTEASIWLYHRLKTVPIFRFARVAWEAGNISTKELYEYIEVLPSHDIVFHVECVMDAELFQKIGSPKRCSLFCPGYYWTGYRGEAYYPLLSNDQPLLSNYFRTLFPTSLP